MPTISTVIEQKGPNMAASHVPKTASSPISLYPLAFHNNLETLAGLRTYNRVEDKAEKYA
jgi:hypothetical protein